MTAPLTPVQTLSIVLKEVGAKRLHPTDQVFSSERYGLFNVGLYARLLEHHPEYFSKQVLHLHPEMADYAMNQIHLDQGWVLSLSEARKAEPVFSVVLENEDPPLFLIDGHHRLMARFLDGQDTITTWVADRKMSDLIHFYKGPVTV